MGLFRTSLVATAAVAFLATTCAAAPAAMISPVRRDLKFNFGQDKIRGVNLGGWLLLEPWITPSIFEATPDEVVDEFTYTKVLGPAEAKTRLEKHWSSWITESDFGEIASKGLNFVRIPIGYWSVTPLDGDPYVQGAYLWLGRALEWAQGTNLKVMIDLHGAPLSQNGLDNSGKRGPIQWGQGNSVGATLNALNKIRDDFASHPAVAAIQLLNEPMGPQLDMNMVRQFMTEGYNNLQSSNVAVAVHDAFQGVTSWNDWGAGMSSLVLDTHHYQVFESGMLQLDAAGHAAAACGFGNQMAASNKVTISGEWSGAMTDCAKWLNGRGVGARYDGTFNFNGQTSQYVGPCGAKYSGTVGQLSEADRANIQRFIHAQMVAYEKADGWIFWTWKTEAAPEWDFRMLTNAGLVPQPLGAMDAGNVETLDLDSDAEDEGFESDDPDTPSPTQTTFPTDSSTSFPSETALPQTSPTSGELGASIVGLAVLAIVIFTLWICRRRRNRAKRASKLRPFLCRRSSAQQSGMPAAPPGAKTQSRVMDDLMAAAYAAENGNAWETGSKRSSGSSLRREKEEASALYASQKPNEKSKSLYVKQLTSGFWKRSSQEEAGNIRAPPSVAGKTEMTSQSGATESTWNTWGHSKPSLIEPLVFHFGLSPLAMKFHRVNNEVVELHNGGGDGTSTSSNKAQAHGLFKVLQDNPPDASDPLKRALPFQPRSYRDFMLFERHYYDAAAGMTQLYRPAIANIVNVVFGLTGVDFPFFKPHSLWYEQPIFYQSNHLAFYADRARVHCPKYCEYLDVELELGAVLGKPLFNASPEEATAAIAGFCVFNDFSVRNVQMAEMSCGFGPQHSKSFANSISSAVVSADEILPRINDLTGRVVINDKTVSECKTGKWQFTIGEAIAHVSKGTRLYPGEFFGSGTFPGGAGVERARFQARIGDVVRLEIDGIGSVTNEIEAEV
ncbi:hypothetical protein DL767_006526 [Monosporascus sp. MG133]|nr:hypothetical protein DL767_006526 [Monosporascus sp. MG133]